MSLGVWKKWKHEVEIYVDMIGPSWRGVKTVLQQACHSTLPLLLTIASMNDSFQKAKRASNDIDPIRPGTCRLVTFYRFLIPKLNFDLPKELRNSAPDNGFELWRLLNRKLDPPRADVEFHFTNDIRKHARTYCTNFERTVRFATCLEVKKREFGVETSTNLDPTLLDEVLGAAMDVDTPGCIEDAGTSIKDHEACKIFCENRFTRMQSRVAGKTLPKDLDKML